MDVIKLSMTPVPEEEEEAYKVVETEEYEVPKIVEREAPKIVEKDTYKVVEISKETIVAYTEEQDAPTTSLIVRFWNVVRRIFCV